MKRMITYFYLNEILRLKKGVLFFKNKFYTIILSFIFCLPIGLKAETESSQITYSMQDLSILYQDKNYIELFEHLKDIRPSERKENWKSMAIQAATSWSEQLLSSKSTDENDFNLLSKVATWKELGESESFANTWEEWLLWLFEKHLPTSKNDQPLDLTKLKKIHEAVIFEWKSLRGNKTSFGPRAAKIYTQLFEEFEEKKISKEEITSFLRPFDDLQALRLAFLAPSLKSQVSLEFCAQEQIYLWILDFLTPLAKETLLELKTNSQKLVTPFEVRLAEYMNRGCWTSVRERLITYFFEGEMKDRERIYPLLLQDRSLEVEKMDAIFIFYLLDGHQDQPALSWSYAKLKSLSFNHKSRQRIMSYMYLKHFLPDAFHSKLPTQKTNFILESFNRYFPEYITHYFKTCLSYLDGKILFTKGNPTANCQNLVLSMEKLSSPATGKQMLENIKNKLKK